MTDALKQARDALKPCPFCGGAARFGKCAPGEVEGSDDGAEYVECERCGASTGLVFPCMDDAKPVLADRWNARADAAQAAPVGYVNGRALQWLHSPDRGTNAHIQVGIFKTPGEECTTPIYTAAPPAPAAQEPEAPKQWSRAEQAAYALGMQNALVAKLKPSRTLAERLAQQEPAQADARDAARYRLLRSWLIKQGLLRAMFCRPGLVAETGDWWVLHPVYMVKGGDCEGYGKDEDAAIDAAMQAKPAGGAL